MAKAFCEQCSITAALIATSGTIHARESRPRYSTTKPIPNAISAECSKWPVCTMGQPKAKPLFAAGDSQDTTGAALKEKRPRP